MHELVVLLSIPGLRSQDVSSMPNLAGLAGGGHMGNLKPSFPCVTLPVQSNMTTGVLPAEHGYIANGFYWRDRGDVEMWTAWNEVIETPQIWDRLHNHDESLTSAVWFPMFAKGCGADYISTPAPIHNPDGSESLWCYTKPTKLYGELRDEFGHFPLMNFWGPMANISSTKWIADSALFAARRFRPRFFYIYLPHLDYAAQKHGPDSQQATAALTELDDVIGRLFAGYQDAGLADTLWLAASEYVITPVDRVGYPNRVLRDGQWLALQERDGQEYLVPGESRAWALVDHQFAHVFVNDASDMERVADLFRSDETVERVVTGEERNEFGLNHARSGDVVLMAQPDAWFAYYWWLDDDKAPDFARTVDIHQKPGYDPVELFIDLPTKSTPLDATLVKGSHGYPADSPDRQGAFLASDGACLNGLADPIRDIDIAGIVLRNFGAT